MEWKEFSGKSLAEAKEKAVKDLGEKEEDLNIEVLESKTRSVLGIISGKKVKIRAKVKGEISIGKKIKDILENILKYIDNNASIEIKEREDGVFLNIISRDSSLIIGRNGTTLASLQHIINKIINKDDALPKKIFLDIDGYRKKREQGLIETARKIASRAKTLKKAFSMSDLSSYDRWLIHSIIEDDDLYTKSIGEGRDRKLIIIPRSLQAQEKDVLKEFEGRRWDT